MLQQLKDEQSPAIRPYSGAFRLRAYAPMGSVEQVAAVCCRSRTRLRAGRASLAGICVGGKCASSCGPRLDRRADRFSAAVADEADAVAGGVARRRRSSRGREADDRVPERCAVLPPRNGARSVISAARSETLAEVRAHGLVDADSMLPPWVC